MQFVLNRTFLRLRLQSGDIGRRFVIAIAQRRSNSRGRTGVVLEAVRGTDIIFDALQPGRSHPWWVGIVSEN